MKSMKTLKIVVTVLLMIILLTPYAFIRTSFAQSPTMYVYPPQLSAHIGSDFVIEIRVRDVTDVVLWQFRLNFNPAQMQCTNATEGPFLRQIGPTMFGSVIDNAAGNVACYCMLMIFPPGASGSGTLAYVGFHCAGAGTGSLHLNETLLVDSMGNPIDHTLVDGVVTQTSMFWKNSYVDYSPSGVPDFDQKQDKWINRQTGCWSYCGPTAVANSLWWMDSRFETSNTPPPTINDTFPLVQSYNTTWDDHDPRNVPPFIQDLAWYMDTDGNRTGVIHNGTRVTDMAQGILNYIRDHGLADAFNVKMMKMPTFEYIDGEVERCEDTILLLGLWQEQPPGSGNWVRVGGHFVTVSGIDLTNRTLAFSDPYVDNAEPLPHGGNGQGQVIPPPPHPHPPFGLPDPVHNDAAYVSHDVYAVLPPSTNPSPGGPQLEINYEPYYLTNLTSNMQGQNCPDEFQPQQGKYNPTWPVDAEVEYGVFVSPMTPMYWKPGYTDYAPSGMPDFDERQWGTYNWSDPKFQAWSHCAPVAEANSLWWLDSEFESGSIPPPTKSDHFTLVTSYNSTWDDHDPRNVPYLVEHLAYLMDTDGRRTYPATGLNHTGTNVTDMQTGLAQYLQWSGVNPIGDVNGDGVVNATDYNIVVAANNTIPGMPRWNMAADIYPVTLGWPSPGKADNVVNQSDIDLVTAHMGQTGKFRERTIPTPDFGLIENEVEKCEDVVLTLGFWVFDGVNWIKEDYAPYPYPNTGKYGHAVTVAGVNSTTSKIAISDPAFDAFETGLITDGRIPVLHNHAQPEPPYTTHNDASLVSQDIYTVMPIPPGCPGGNWAIAGYPPGPGMPGLFAVIENAVIVSPVHDVCVTNVTSLKTVICQGYKGNVTVTVENHGGYSETFNVTAYANNTANGNVTSIGTLTNVTLATGTSANLTVLWNTTGYAKGNYTLSAYGWPVPDEINTTNNNCTGGWIIISIVGDITGPNGWPDGTCDMRDIRLVAKGFGANLVTNQSSPKYCQYWHSTPCTGCPHSPNCDITGPTPSVPDGSIDMRDIRITATNFGKTDP